MLPRKTFMPDDQKDLAYYLSKAADFRNKAKVVSEPGLKAALKAGSLGVHGESTRA